MNAKKILLALAALVAFSVNSVNAGVLMTPPGLGVGDTFHLAFVTDEFLMPSSTDITTYDAFVQASANAGSLTSMLGLNWKVIGSTSTVDAINHVPVSGPIYLLDFTTKVADDQADLWDGTIDAPINLTANNNTINGGLGSQPWTGTTQFGAGFPFAELGKPATNVVAYGSTTQTNSAWVAVGQLTGGNSRPLYALSDAITVDGGGEVPEPASLAVWICVAGIGVVGAQRRRRGKSQPA